MVEYYSPTVIDFTDSAPEPRPTGRSDWPGPFPFFDRGGAFRQERRSYFLSTRRSDATPLLVPVGVASVTALSALPVPWSGTR